MLHAGLHDSTGVHLCSKRCTDAHILTYCELAINTVDFVKSFHIVHMQRWVIYKLISECNCTVNICGWSTICFLSIHDCNYMTSCIDVCAVVNVIPESHSLLVNATRTVYKARPQA